jgi:outer membrane protein
MRSFKMLSAVALLLSSVGIASSYAADAPKIAVADNLEALMKSDEAKKQLDALQKELAQDKKKIEALEADLKKLNKQLDTDKAVMSEEQQKKLLKDAEEKSVDRNFLIQKYQKRQQEGQQEVVKAMRPKFQAAIEAVVKKGGYDIILHKQALVYSGEAFDVTDDITAKLNESK